jgi:phenylalanine-4-hydroxylase
MYEAIRLLSIVKEAEDTPQATIEEAEKQWKICKIIWVNYLKWRKSEIYTGGPEYGLIGTNPKFTVQVYYPP